MSDEKELIVNKIMCPDGYVLQSRHHYDYVEHKCDNGDFYFLDGGLSYQRYGGTHIDKITNLALYTTDPHEFIRSNFTWLRQMDADGQLLMFPEEILLQDITYEHLLALIDWTSTEYPAKIHQVFVNELSWRKVYGISAE